MPDRGAETALVTGASGTVGRVLCARLVDSGWRVIGLSSRNPGFGPWARYVARDLGSTATATELAAALKEEAVKVVWHLAGKAHALAERAQDPQEYRRINVSGTQVALELARQLGARRFVFASSVKAMGEGGNDVFDESVPCAPQSPYGRSKLEAEQLTLTGGFVPEPVVLRFCMVYGGADRGNMARMLNAVAAGRFPPFPETGNRRSFVHVEDAVQACLLAGMSPAAPGETFLVTDGQCYSTRELYAAMREALGVPPARARVPLWVFRMAARAGDFGGALLRRRMPLDSDSLAKLTESAAYSSRKIAGKLGYRPAWTLERGLHEMAGRKLRG